MAHVLRSKGFLWFASRPEWKTLVQTAGQQALLEPAGTWWALVAEEEWPAGGEELWRTFDDLLPQHALHLEKEL